MSSYFTLVAYKPEKVFWDRGDMVVLPSIFVREEFDDEKALLNRWKELKQPQKVKYEWGIEEDKSFEQFHLFFTDEDYISLEDLAKIKINEEKYKKEQLESTLEPCDTCGAKPVRSNGICH